MKQSVWVFFFIFCLCLLCCCHHYYFREEILSNTEKVNNINWEFPMEDFKDMDENLKFLLPCIFTTDLTHTWDIFH